MKAIGLATSKPKAKTGAGNRKMNMNSTIRILPATAYRPPVTNTKAFTLVEVLVVVGILVLLIGIFVPALDMMRQEMKAKLTQSNITLIATACDMYANDFDGEVPPSVDANGDYFQSAINNKGKKIIVLLLTGYAGDGDTSGLPRESASLDKYSEDDGRAGFGFRTVQRGKVYGPYNGTEKIPTVEGSDPPVFADAFGNPILYYKADANFDLYELDNNDGGNDDPSQDILDQYEPSKKPFLIITPGKNKTWNESGNNNDDLVN